MTKEPDQGAMVTSRPTSRSLNPAPEHIGTGGNFTTGVIDARPGVMAQRALAPIPGDTITVLENAPGGFCAQHLAGAGTFAAERFEPGDASDNVEAQGQGGKVDAKGSASKVTGRPIMGKTAGKGTI
jgi:hypothetical protein